MANPFAIGESQSMGPPATINTLPAGGPGFQSAPPASSYSIPNTMKTMGPPMSSTNMGPPPQSMGWLPGPQQSMSAPMPAPMPAPSMPPMKSMPMQSMPMQSMPSIPQQPQWISNVARPQMTQVSNPPVTSGNIQYGPSYSMQYQKRSTADKTAVKYTGFLPLEGVYEEDTCRIG
eukprot:gnl/MRDRNA2_/MRDRNA2_89290_c0_seq1.p1 gnl/MRDRNA2_/MRDRNA2_89290_c0~~gnl/MRDRNA2_/MRDRNA2_89290_c0_seq1.p1  ORF type:complete len:203 (+),score=28.72 gnl/MRDRNA2_/MRDRNA2_89290_c0_seq1:87-611(+)